MALFLKHLLGTCSITYSVCSNCVFYTEAAAVCVFATTQKENPDSKTTEVQQHSFISKRHFVFI